MGRCLNDLPCSGDTVFTEPEASEQVRFWHYNDVPNISKQCIYSTTSLSSVTLWEPEAEPWGTPSGDTVRTRVRCLSFNDREYREEKLPDSCFQNRIPAVRCVDTGIGSEERTVSEDSCPNQMFDDQGPGQGNMDGRDVITWPIFDKEPFGHVITRPITESTHNWRNGKHNIINRFFKQNLYST